MNLSFIYRGPGAFPNSSRLSACIGCAGDELSPWIARYNVQKTPPPSQNFRGFLISSSSSSGVLRAFLDIRLPIL